MENIYFHLFDARFESCGKPYFQIYYGADYMDDFSPGWPGLISMISMHACTTGVVRRMRVTILARLAQTGLKLLSYNRTRYFNMISSRGRAENSPCNQPLKVTYLFNTSWRWTIDITSSHDDVIFEHAMLSPPYKILPVRLCNPLYSRAEFHPISVG